MTERKPLPRACYTALECADLLGLSLDQFYEQRPKLHEIQNMPRPVTLGRIKIPKLAFDAWLNRDHPNAPRRRPDNDPVPLPQPQTDQDHRDYLRVAYRRG